MSKRALFAHSALSDAAQITASSEAGPSMRANNLKYMQGGRVSGPRTAWRARGTSESITLLLPEGAVWDLVALHYFNFSAAATVSVLAADSEAGLDAPVWTSGIIPAWRVGAEGMRGWPWPWVHSWVTAPSDRNERWVRIEIEDPEPRDIGQIQGSGVMVAKAWRPDYHVEPGHSLSPATEAPRSVDLSMTGGVLISPTVRGRAESVAVTAMESKSLSTCWELTTAVGLSGPVWYQFDPDDEAYGLRRSMVARFAEEPRLAEIGTEMYRVEFAMREIL